MLQLPAFSGGSGPWSGGSEAASGASKQDLGATRPSRYHALDGAAAGAQTRCLGLHCATAAWGESEPLLSIPLSATACREGREGTTLGFPGLPGIERSARGGNVACPIRELQGATHYEIRCISRTRRPFIPAASTRPAHPYSVRGCRYTECPLLVGRLAGRRRPAPPRSGQKKEKERVSGEQEGIAAGSGFASLQRARCLETDPRPLP